MSRHNLTNWEWNSIRFFLPAERPRKAGRPWNAHRQVINGILWVLCTGSSWKDMPAEFGNFKTIYNRFRRWTQEGLWDRIVEKLIHRLDEEDLIDRSVWCVDSSVIRAHRVAAGAPRKGRDSSQNASQNALGRSRGGYSTKIHVVTDGRGLPLAITATPGQNGEAPEFPNLITSTFVSLHRKHKRPRHLAADKAYSSAAIRSLLNQMGIRGVIPKRSDQRGSHRFNRRLYRKRNIIERLIGRLKEYRRIATRYDKIVDNYLAMAKIAFIRIILKSN